MLVNTVSRSHLVVLGLLCLTLGVSVFVSLRRTSLLNAELDRLSSLAEHQAQGIATVLELQSTLTQQVGAQNRTIDLVSMRLDALALAQQSQNSSASQSESGEEGEQARPLDDPAAQLVALLRERMEVSTYSLLTESDRVGLTFYDKPFEDRFDNAVYVLDEGSVSICVLSNWLDTALPTDARAALEELAKATYLRRSLCPYATELLLTLGEFLQFDSIEQAREYVREQMNVKSEGALEIVPLRDGGFAVLESETSRKLSTEIAKLDAQIAQLRAQLEAFGPIVMMERPRT